MDQITTIGLDIAKQVFQVHGITANGTVKIRRQFRRAEVLRFFEKLPPCLIGLEACGGAHYWAREISAFGHDVRLIPPAYVKPYLKRGKTDALDAEAICEAVTRPNMRFVPIKSVENQASAMLLKTRELLVRQRTQVINALRSHLGELGIVAAKGTGKVADLAAIVRDQDDRRLPTYARMALVLVVRQIEDLAESIEKLDREIVDQVKKDDTSRRLTTIPGIGPIAAATIMAAVPDPKAFTSGRHFSAWIGLTPRMNSSGGKERMGGISRMGNPALRVLLVLGATSVLRYVKAGKRVEGWFSELLKRRPAKVATVALANKMARVVWALLVKGGTFTRKEKSEAAVLAA